MGPNTRCATDAPLCKERPVNWCCQCSQQPGSHGWFTFVSPVEDNTVSHPFSPGDRCRVRHRLAIGPRAGILTEADTCPRAHSPVRASARVLHIPRSNRGRYGSSRSWCATRQGAGVTGRHFPHRWRHSYATASCAGGRRSNGVRHTKTGGEYQNDGRLSLPCGSNGAEPTVEQETPSVSDKTSQSAWTSQ